MSGQHARRQLAIMMSATSCAVLRSPCAQRDVHEHARRPRWRTAGVTAELEVAEVSLVLFAVLLRPALCRLAGERQGVEHR